MNPVTLIYTNYRGEMSERTITPQRVWYGSTEWHPEPQWLITAFDHEKQANRDFALKDFGYLAPSTRAQALEEAAKIAEGDSPLFYHQSGDCESGFHSGRVAAAAAIRARSSQHVEDGRKFKLGDRLTKNKGSSWTGLVVGFYSTELTPVGYAVESETEKGSVQIYPEAALHPLPASPGASE